MRIGDERIKSERTTPEATDLQALLAVMRERGADAVTMEVSSHALVLGRVDGCVFDVAVFNNLSPEHMEFHSGMEDYFQAKARLFTPQRSRQGVVNFDDEYGRRLITEASVPITTFSAEGHPDADWRAEDVEVGRLGSTFTVVGPKEERATARAPLPGPFNVANTLAAIVTLAVAGIDPQIAADGVAVARGARPAGADRRRTAVPRPRRLRAQDRRRRIGAPLPPAGHGGQAAHRPRLRRRPRHHQARPDGSGRRPALRHRRADLRQPPLGGPPRHPGRHARRRRGSARARTRRRPGRRRPGRRHRRRGRPAGPATP